MQTDEIRRCARDPHYFLNTYAKIPHPVKGPVIFKTFPFQDDCLKAFVSNRYVIVNKSRQLGLTTLATAYAAWLLIFHRNKEVLVMATKLKTAMGLIRKVKHVVNSLPKWLVLPKIVEDNKQSLIFGAPSNSRVEAIPTAPDAGRSEALSLLIIDEAAHINNFDELWTGLNSTLSTGGRAIIISTPKGVGNQFHTLWKDAQDGTSEFFPILLPWDVHPERDQAWFENECTKLSKKGVAQELLCDFGASGDTYLEASDIEWVSQNIIDPIRREGPERNVWVWKEPIIDDDVKYIISADVGRGDSNDYSTFHVINTTLAEQVAEYRGKIRPDKFANLLAEYAIKYNNALIAPEKNTYGNHVLIHLIDYIGYTNIYYENKKHAPVGDYVQPNSVSNAGFDMQKGSRENVLTKLEEVIRNRVFKTYSSRLYDEFKTFIMKGRKPQAQKSCNDDLVMALAIGLYLFDVSGTHSHFATKLNSAMLGGFGMSHNDFENLSNNGNEVLPSWTGMVPYAGGTGIEANKKRKKNTNPAANMDWLF